MSSKFTRLPPDHLILERRRQEDLRGAMADQTRYFHKTLLQSQWERETDRKLAHNHVTAKLHRVKLGAEELLDRRRECLREMLDKERDDFIGELNSISAESDADKRDRMRKRAEELRQARERERQLLADEKQMLRFRNDCVELRAVHSKQLEEAVISERGAQLDDRQKQKEIERKEEAHFAQLWEEDRLKKVAREERDAAKRAQLNAETLQILRRQLADLKRRQELDDLLKAQQAELMKEQAELYMMEREREETEHRRRQQATREELAKYGRMHARRLQKQLQEEMALDLRILEEALAKNSDDTDAKRAEKRRLKEEALKYRQYIAEMRSMEQQREKERDALLEQESEREWERKLERIERERFAREKLMGEVLRTRREQIEYKLRENERLQHEGFVERQELLVQIDENRRIEETRREALQRTRDQYRSDLTHQIAYQQRTSDEERRLEQEELMLSEEAEREYNRMLQIEMTRRYDPKTFHQRKSSATIRGGRK
eukprot:Opistho-2@49454